MSRATIGNDSVGAIVMTMPIGVDVVGVVRDYQGDISYEQHPVSLPPEALSPLAPADRESLAVNIVRHLTPANPNNPQAWLQLLKDAVPPWAQVPGIAQLDLSRATISRDTAGHILVYAGIGVDVMATLRADSQGNVLFEQHPVSLPVAQRLLPLAPADLVSLAAIVERRAASQDPGGDVLWQELLADMTTGRAQATRFDGVDFLQASIAMDQQGGVKVQLALGVDVVGNLYADNQGHVTFEQHPVSLPGPHPLYALSQADRESLAANIERYLQSSGLNAADLWGKVVTDSLKCY